MVVAIVVTSSGVRAGQARDEVTFSEQVAPIVFEKCATCHRPGEAAPFSLQSYEDVRRRGTLIAAVVTSHQMPPWKAESGDYAFRGDRRLSANEIDVITRWVAAGMPEGDRARLPKMPAFTEGWQLGTPDLIVRMSEPFEVPAYGPDIYRNFVLPLNLAEDTWVKAIDFRPSARGVVHHSLFYADATGAARARDAADPKPGFDGSMGGFAGARGGLQQLLMGRGAGAGAASGAGASNATDLLAEQMRAASGLGGWALGALPRALPEGLAYFLPKKSDLVLSTHFHSDGKVEKEASVVGLYFSKTPPTQAFTSLQLPPVFGVFEGLNIPPGEHYTLTDSWVLPVDVKAFNIFAHAHYLAREMVMTATFPDATVHTLLSIKDWDFAWQEQYQFQSYVPLPKGTKLDVRITYDNSEANPRNPSHPPIQVSWGEQSTDEMGSMGIQVITDRPEDLAALEQAYARKVQMSALTKPGLRQFMSRRQQAAPPER
ncbi:MAG: hypothetical protein LBQ09_03870 [Acidobacteriaceae bacterium]|nr:hypothetical protein [Acidobacteriaceae bacterium]